MAMAAAESTQCGYMPRGIFRPARTNDSASEHLPRRTYSYHNQLANGVCPAAAAGLVASRGHAASESQGLPLRAKRVTRTDVSPCKGRAVCSRLSSSRSSWQQRYCTGRPRLFAMPKESFVYFREPCQVNTTHKSRHWSRR